MRIELQAVAKRYRREWILRQVNLDLQAPRRYAVTGPNGSGKSTLLKILSGHLTPSRGSIRFSQNGSPIPISEVYQELTFAAPYIELIEEYTLVEALRFHARFKPFLPGLDREGVIELLGLGRARDLPLNSFSSGMKQRVKLALACCSRSRLLLLDEPTTNLDAQGAAWYLNLVDTYAKDRLVIVASNVEADYQFCDEIISIPAFKKRIEAK